LTLIYFLRARTRTLWPEGEARVAHAVNERERAVRGISPTVREGSAKTNASFSAQLFREIAGRICRQLIRQSRLRWQAMVDSIRFARMVEINSIYISRVARRL
jgi:hypothetical protein